VICCDMPRVNVIRNLMGDGRWRRDAASLSPGASNATTGAPRVAPRSDAGDPPRECSTNTIFQTSSPEMLDAHTNISAIYSHLGTGMSHCCKDSADKLKPVL
jgi:hypothetical protein